LWGAREPRRLRLLGRRPMPDLMLWDSSTNVDVDVTVHEHVKVTKHEADPAKQFSRATVKRQDSAYLRCLHPCDAQGQPLPDCVGGPPHLRKRAWQDQQQCLGPTLDALWRAEGKSIQGMGNKKQIRNGHRYVKSGGQGGKRPRTAKDTEPAWLHLDAQPAAAARLGRAVQRHNG
jgi:hypothetical protein